MSARPARILVVDDAPRNVKLLADLLTATGYHVLTASSGAAALERVRGDAPDLVLLDVVMPGMSGYEVCRAIRDDPATAMLPVVMVTALEASAERIRGLEAGADDFLAKPISQPELLARVRSLLRIKRLHDTVEAQAAQLAEWNRQLERRVEEQVELLERLGRLKRFLPPQIVERVVAGDAEDPLRSHRREIVVVAARLHGFVAFAETSAPEEVIAVLQDFHAALGRLAGEQQGTVERFTGDGAMVFFNDPLEQPDAAARALRLALAVCEQGRELSGRWERHGFDLKPSLGIGQGYATLGAVGLEVRSDYVAVGTVTAMAARLSEAAGPGEILASRRALASAGEGVDAEPAGDFALPGFLRPVAAFRVLGSKAVAVPGSAEALSETGKLPSRVFRQEGEFWTIAYEGQVMRLKDAKGLRYIAHLLRHPERDFHALDLVATHRVDEEDRPAARPDAGELPRSGLGDAGAVLDAQAKAAYRHRLEDLRSELGEAEGFNDAERATRLRAEIDALTQQLASAVGLGGRDRRTGAAAERARVSVTKAITDSLRRIREHCPLLARHLDASIRTGTFCRYAPPDPTAGGWRT